MAKIGSGNAKSYNTGAKLNGGAAGGFSDQVVGKRQQRQTEPGLTWVGGNRAYDDLDEGSRKNLAASATGTSIFDPTLVELAVRWFCPPAGRILDPFAGGSVRGVVASHLGRAYVGVDLRPEQVAANEGQLRICKEPMPRWIVGDSLALPDLVEEGDFDFLLSCPPYGDLEVYSDNEADLSTMDYADFLTAYGAIVQHAANKLADNRFACFVVGDFRDKAGMYRGFPGHSVAAFERAGLHLYNEAILVTAAGSLPIRARKQFESGRKLGRTHQVVQIFVKGDPRKATAAIGKVEFGIAIDAGDGAGDEFEVSF
jgi:hypothetical protein